MLEITKKKAWQFVKKYAKYNASDFLEDLDKDDDSILVDIPNLEIKSIKKENLGDIDVDGVVGMRANISNKTFSFWFFNKYFPVVKSTYDKVTVKVEDNLYAELDKDCVYEYDDMK